MWKRLVSDMCSTLRSLRSLRSLRRLLTLLRGGLVRRRRGGWPQPLPLLPHSMLPLLISCLCSRPSSMPRLSSRLPSLITRDLSPPLSPHLARSRSLARSLSVSLVSFARLRRRQGKPAQGPRGGGGRGEEEERSLLRTGACGKALSSPDASAKAVSHLSPLATVAMCCSRTLLAKQQSLASIAARVRGEL